MSDNLPGVTPKLKGLARSTIFSMDTLRSAKIRGHLTDFGLEQLCRSALSRELSPYTLINLLEFSIYHHHADGHVDPFMRTQREYHGASPLIY